MTVNSSVHAVNPLVSSVSSVDIAVALVLTFCFLGEFFLGRQGREVLERMGVRGCQR